MRSFDRGFALAIAIAVVSLLTTAISALVVVKVK
jgi:hypothetical protein